MSHAIELILYLEMAEGAKAVIIFVTHLSMTLKPAWLPTYLKDSWEVFLHASLLCVLIETWETKEAGEVFLKRKISTWSSFLTEEGNVLYPSVHH